MVGKKAYLKTLEVILALVFTFAFILYILPSHDASVDEEAKKILIHLMDDDGFREQANNLTSCINRGDNQTINTYFDSTLYSYIEYYLCPQGMTPSLPRKKVNVESLYLTGNMTDSTQKIVKLYYFSP